MTCDRSNLQSKHFWLVALILFYDFVCGVVLLFVTVPMVGVLALCISAQPTYFFPVSFFFIDYD